MGVVFRESYPNLQDLIKKAYRLYSGYPYFGDYNKTDKLWRFPSNVKELADPANLEAVAHKLIEPIYVDGQCAQVRIDGLSFEVIGVLAPKMQAGDDNIQPCQLCPLHHYG
jgi:hypothetical protein